MKCGICGRELNALNLSDIELDKCQDCVSEILEKMDTDDESGETRRMSIGEMEKIIRKVKRVDNGGGGDGREKKEKYNVFVNGYKLEKVILVRDVSKEEAMKICKENNKKLIDGGVSEEGLVVDARYMFFRKKEMMI